MSSPSMLLISTEGNHWLGSRKGIFGL